jgi:hypothetical protein
VREYDGLGGAGPIRSHPPCRHDGGQTDSAVQPVRGRETRWPAGWMVDEAAQQLWHDEVFGPLLAADNALLRVALCDNV